MFYSVYTPHNRVLMTQDFNRALMSAYTEALHDTEACIYENDTRLVQSITPKEAQYAAAIIASRHHLAC
jgi:hypothetical protein